MLEEVEEHVSDRVWKDPLISSLKLRVNELPVTCVSPLALARRTQNVAQPPS